MIGLKILMPQTYEAERLYITDVVFHQFLKIEYEIEWSEQKDLYHIAYNNGSISFPDSFFSAPIEDWLSVKVLPELPLHSIQAPDGFPYQMIPILYGKNNLGLAGLDVLGSIFFMITRYEEITDNQVDSFGRYDHRNSVLFKEGFLMRALANEYLEILKLRVQSIAPEIVFHHHVYRPSMSHDVDVPLTFNGGWLDLIKKSLGDIYFRGSIDLAYHRWKGRLKHLITNSFEDDPNYNFEFIMNAEEKASIRGIFNFIPVSGTRPVDSQYELNHPAIQKLLERLNERGFEIGFHPSYDSFGNFEQTRKELQILNNALSGLNIKPATRGRQHYLRWTNPDTWRIWDELGLTEDSSVGYGLINGFRTGCCYKYTVFDLVQRKALSLVEEPLIFMDVNSNVNSMSLLREIKCFVDVCKLFNGNFTVLYHNNYIISKRQKNLFLRVIEIIK